MSTNTSIFFKLVLNRENLILESSIRTNTYSDICDSISVRIVDLSHRNLKDLPFKYKYAHHLRLEGNTLNSLSSFPKFEFLFLDKDFDLSKIYNFHKGTNKDYLSKGVLQKGATSVVMYTWENFGFKKLTT